MAAPAKATQLTVAVGERQTTGVHIGDQTSGRASCSCIVFVCRVCKSGLCARFGGRQIQRSTHRFAVLRFLLFLFDVDFGGRVRISNRDDGGNGNSNRVDAGSRDTATKATSKLEPATSMSGTGGSGNNKRVNGGSQHRTEWQSIVVER